MASVSCFYSGTIGPRTIAGGDRHGLEIWSAWSSRPDCSLCVYTSYWGRDLIQAFDYSLKAIATESEPSVIGPSRLGYFRRFARALVQALRAPHSDVVYAASPYFYDVLPAIVLKLRSRARMNVALFHLIPPPSRRTGSRVINTMAWVEQQTMLWFIKHFADRIVVDNTQLVRDLERIGIARDRIVLSPMGIRDLPHADAAVQCKRFDAIYVGRLAGPKGVPGLIDAWKRVTHAVPTAKLALVGNNEVAFDAERLVREAELQNCIGVFLGLSDEQVREMLFASRFFITASTEEGYGLAVLEALAAGLPCVTFDIPAFQAAFPHGRHPAKGFAYTDLADAAIDLLQNDALRESLRENIRTHVSVKTWPQIAGELWQHCVAE